MGVSTDAILVFGIDLGDECGADEKLAALIEKSDDCELNDDRAEIVTHCHHENRMVIVAVPKTEMRAYRGDAKVVSVKDLSISDNQVRALAAFCKDHGIEWRDPLWLLCSMWG